VVRSDPVRGGALMADVVPGSVPGRPWLDRRPDETFEDFVSRLACTCTLCGREFASPNVPLSHAETCTGIDVDLLVMGIELNIWPFD